MKKKRNQKPFSLFSILSLTVFFTVLLALIVSEYSVELADLLNSTVSTAYRVAMAKLSDPFDISLFELVIALLPIAVIIVIWLAVRRFQRGEGRVRFLVNLTSLVLLVYSGHLLALGIAYNTTELSDRLGIPTVKVTEENLAELMVSLRDEANLLSLELQRDGEGVTDSGYTLDEISALICDSYRDFSEEYSFPYAFDSRAKPIRYSGLMSYLSLTGIYTYYTGESNVNMKYPDFDIVFTAAHELSHQRGILRENEANFMAYLICSRSPDPYLRYSAALSMYCYISSALYRTNPELHGEIAAGLAEAPRADIRASNAVSREYGDTILSDISRTVNDLFLKSSGTGGVVSYGRVVILAVSYNEANKSE